MRNQKPLVGIVSLFAASCHHLDVATKLFVATFAGLASTNAGGVALGAVNGVLALSYVVSFWHLWGWTMSALSWLGQNGRRAQVKLEILLKKFVRVTVALGIKLMRWTIRWMKRIGGWFK